MEKSYQMAAKYLQGANSNRKLHLQTVQVRLQRVQPKRAFCIIYAYKKEHRISLVP
jgi:hypothetical protein